MVLINSKSKKATPSLITEAIEHISVNNLLPLPGSKIAIAMSGGVDSSVAAALLRQMDYEVIGITGWLMKGSGKCCDGGMIDSARVAEEIGIEHISMDLREAFQSKIISPFLGSYRNGRTPVPCMPCNTEIKWGALLEHCQELGCSHLASGHYARVRYKEEYYQIGRPCDSHKDQSYMLWGLDQQQLSRTAFPLANFSKEYIRELAKELNLYTWDKEESQDVCFVPDKNTDYLKNKLGERPGTIKHIATKETLGKHLGTHLFTIGQRKGIGLSNSCPLYVIKLDPSANIVYVGEREYLLTSKLEAEFANWQTKIDRHLEGMLKIRYNSPPASAQITITSESTFSAEFTEEQMSITPGQAAVVYDTADEWIIGGGWISGLS